MAPDLDGGHEAELEAEAERALAGPLQPAHRIRGRGSPSGNCEASANWRLFRKRRGERRRALFPSSSNSSDEPSQDAAFEDVSELKLPKMVASPRTSSTRWQGAQAGRIPGPAMRMLRSKQAGMPSPEKVPASPNACGRLFTEREPGESATLCVWCVAQPVALGPSNLGGAQYGACLA